MRVHVTSSTIDYESFSGASNPPRVDLPAGDWAMITQSAAAGDSLTVEATKLSASGVTGPVKETWTVAQGTLKGIVYYNSYDSPLAQGDAGSQNDMGAVMRIRPGAAQP